MPANKRTAEARPRTTRVSPRWRTNQFKIKPGTGKVAVFLNQRQIATALARTRKGESLDDQLFKLERQFQALGQALENRNKLMTKHHWRDGLSVVWH